MAHSRFCLSFLLTIGFGIWSSAAAHAASTAWAGDSRAAVRLITGIDSLAADANLDAGLEFRFANGWHGYWRTPGDAGVGPVIDWSGSENIARSEVAWPAPHRLVIEGLQNSVYENRVVLPVKLFPAFLSGFVYRSGMLPARKSVFLIKLNSRCPCWPEKVWYRPRPPL
jgi:suppressor for copper-sensitivity B